MSLLSHKPHDELLERILRKLESIEEKHHKTNMLLTDLATAITALDTSVNAIAAAITSAPSGSVPQSAVDALTKLTTDLAALSAMVTPVTGIPVAPAGLSATPGPGSVMLSFSPSPGAVSYSVKSSAVAGGPYSPVATPAPVTASPVTVSAPSGVPVFYVVSAVNASGESPNSVEVPATPA